MAAATDYQTVLRPFFQTLGGNGLLQNLGAFNHALALDDSEARVSNRISVNNYLRVAGGQLGWDVRTFGGAMNSGGAPNPMKPFIRKMVLAAYANDHEGFQSAMKLALAEAKSEGDKPDEAMKKVVNAYEGQNPLTVVFKSRKTEAEMQKLIAQLPDSGKQSVNQVLQLFQHYGMQIGADRSVYGKDKSAGTMTAQAPLLRDPVTSSMWGQPGRQRF
jgi:hypothetical protein